MKNLSEKIKQVKPSVTLAISAKAKQMKKEGNDVISFGAGEPDFDTPENIKQAGISAIENGETRYTPAAGTPELKQAVINKIQESLGLKFELNQIIINCGAKHSIYNVLQVLCNTEDNVIVPAPYWVSYPEQIKLAGAAPKIMETSDQQEFKITAKQLEQTIDKNTKALILNSPSNPTGAVYSKEELQAIADICVKHDLYVISDEIYDKLMYEGTEFTSIATLGDEILKRTIIINGVSKTYAMTGWRIGYTAANKEIIKAISSLQSQSTSNPTSISQKASIEALSGDQNEVTRMLTEFAKRRLRMLELLNNINDVSVYPSQGAFYLFPNISVHYGKSYKGQKINNSVDFSECLLENSLVAVIPGAGFGADDYIRLSYATSMQNIEKGLGRIKNFINSLE